MSTPNPSTDRGSTARWRQVSVIAALLGCATVHMAKANDDVQIKGPVHLIVSYTPGGGAIDLTARALQRPLQKELGVRVLVDNRPGGSTKIGTDIVRNAAPDGTTLTIMSAPGWVGFYHSKIFDYKPWEELTAVAQVAESPFNVMTVSGKSLYKTWGDVVSASHKSGKPIKAGSPSAGGFMQLAFERIMKKFDLKGIYVPYPGAAPGRNALLGGEIDIQMDSGAAFQPIRGGLIRGIAISWEKRYPLQADIPIYKDLDFGFELPINNYVIWGPPGMKPALVKRLSDALKKATDDKDFIDLIQTKNAMLISFKPGAEIVQDTRKTEQEWGSSLDAVAPR